ncbi:MAG: iron-containing alcohol dehydrogenase [Clostridia bacterium]|nr:iron-containing alcohol dehydrogenase [Clostridia bacterium]
MPGFKDLDTLIREGGFYCPHCGRVHGITVEKVVLADGALSSLPGEIKRKGLCRPYVFADPNTFRAAGERVCGLLAEAGIEYKKQVINDPRPAPDERTLGDAAMHWDPSRDCVIGVGGGVVNDTCKLLAKLTGKPYFYVATAPSMDGYASTSSSMDVHGLKTSLPADPAGVIILDTSVLAEAPAEMILAGIGDMAAKYISLCEWKIATVITGEYYCPEVAGMMASSLKKVIENSSAAVNRDKEAIGSVAEGLVLAGLAMTCAGVSRPASGMEHYISHIRDMRGLSYGTRTDLHGIQCGFAVLPCLRAYEKLRRARPDRDAAIAAFGDFDYEKHAKEMREFVGEGAEAMISLEAKEGKYDKAKHPARLDRIIGGWDEICSYIDELPSSLEYAEFCRSIGFPTEPAEIGMTADELCKFFDFAGDVRDKYVLSRLCRDVGAVRTRADVAALISE